MSGGGAGGGTQGLAHWMSVMAEHMNHESSLHPAYMWHNGIDQKMSITEQQQLLQKGGTLISIIEYFWPQKDHQLQDSFNAAKPHLQLYIIGN